MARAKRKPPVEKSCKRCNSAFLVAASAAEKGFGLFCSKECNNADGSVSKECLACGSVFSVIRYRSDQKFCSRKCSDKGMNRKKAKPKTSLVCQCCGKVFLVKTTVMQVKRKYCSQACHGKAKRKHPDELAFSFRSTSPPEYVAWVKAVLLRDMACVRCKAVEPLQAHHVKPWNRYPELRYDVNNGVALCPCCHHSQHPYLSLEVFLKMGGKRVLRCVVCESPYVQTKKQQQACSVSCGQKIRRLREKSC